MNLTLRMLVKIDFSNLIPRTLSLTYLIERVWVRDLRRALMLVIPGTQGMMVYVGGLS